MIGPGDTQVKESDGVGRGVLSFALPTLTIFLRFFLELPFRFSFFVLLNIST